MQIDRLLEASDLTVIHAILSMVGFFLAVYVMQLTHYEAEDDVDPWFLRHLRRIAHAILAWGFLWTLSYSETRGWQPWPPFLMIIFAMDLILLIRALAIKARIARVGIKPDAPRAAVAKQH